MKWTGRPPCASASRCSWEGQHRLCDWAPGNRQQVSREQPLSRDGELFRQLMEGILPTTPASCVAVGKFL